ncbi:MAG: hypothetical protein Q8Q08_11890 [Candidatus Omnitrophota bacterium]|nr:hypothetical protein [Candidatus Omnitrophota bacterium]
MGAAGAYLYAIAGNEVYRVDSNDLSTQKIYNETVMEEDADLLINGEETDTVFNSSALKDMVVLDGGRQYIFLAADSGVLFKNVDEERWHDLPRLGLVPETVTSLAVAVISSHGPENAPFVAEEPSFPWRGFRIFAGTNNGVYELAGNQWTATASGMSGGHVLSLAMAGDKLFAGTDRGVFALSPEESAILGSISDAQVATVKERFAKEPTVSEVQLLALEYADVSPQKIKRWQKAAQSSAWMPTLSTGLSRADTELFHWDSGGNPDSLLKGRDYLDWSLSLSWDFSEVIWNPAQTSIDSRAKLMSELREDILDQVTRIYFERRRMQMELLLDAAADARSHLEREMRIAELTALLDAHTGGGFSRLCAMN